MTVVSNLSQLPAGVRSLTMAVATIVAAILSTAVANAQTTAVHPNTIPEKSIAHPDFTPVRVMTRNVYDGLEPDDYKHLSVCENFDTALKDTVNNIIRADPKKRAALHAGQIALEHPDLLAIQEAVVAQIGDMKVDMLGALIDDLKNIENTPYDVILTSRGLDIESGNILFFVQDALLVRSDLLLHKDAIVNDHKQELYKQSLNVTIPSRYAPGNSKQPCGTKMNFRRNWMFVDMQLRGYPFRFVTTHLDFLPDLPDSARQQAAELMPIVSNTRLPVIVTGDFNYSYDDFTWQDWPGLAAAGYRDAWVTASDRDVSSTGRLKATCCQADTWGSYPKDSPWTRTEKVDLILLRGGVSATTAHLVGAVSPPCSPQGCTLLASDHAGVVADVIFTSTINSRRPLFRSQ
jgi:endonuclease/exonuclease/phosphatase family metal-dependent hydrolase